MGEFDSTQREHFANLLEKGANSLNFPLDSVKIAQLIDYLALFHKWNKAYNLSAIRDPEEMLSKHLLDSLSIAPFIAEDSGQRFIDVGTGGGLPGIPLAICIPGKHFTLLDSVGKKTRFLVQVQQALALKNVQVENCRVENFEPAQLYDGVISRAFASLADMLRLTQHLLKESGKFWAMKGNIPKDELSEIEKHYKVKDCHQLQVERALGARCLITIDKK